MMRVVFVRTVALCFAALLLCSGTVAACDLIELSEDELMGENTDTTTTPDSTCEGAAVEELWAHGVEGELGTGQAIPSGAGFDAYLSVLESCDS